MKIEKTLHLVVAALAALLLYSCANIGNPSGGPRDYTPPRYLKSSPAQGQLNFKGNKVEIEFDEYIQLTDQQKKVVISPVQHQSPSIKSLGKKISIEFRDTMLPNTTYIVDFSNAISDNNESNQLKDFAISFSTGDSIDSLEISGVLLNARNLEPMQYTVVGLHSNLDDSAFTTTALERVARTNDRGQFTLRNLKPGRYHVFALNDVDGNYKMSRTEDYAFLDDIIVPSTRPYTSVDTIFTFDHRVDTTFEATHTEFLPNDVLLTMFNENYRTQYLKRIERQSGRIVLQLGAASDTLPRLRILSPQPKREQWAQIETREENDSITYWFTDSTLAKADTIEAEIWYPFTDSLGQIVNKLDTMKLGLRKTNAELRAEARERKRLEEEAKAREAELKHPEKSHKKKEKKEKKPKAESQQELTAEEKEFERKQKALNKKDDDSNADEDENPHLRVQFDGKAQLGVTDSLTFVFDAPVDSIDQQKIHIDIFNDSDSVWSPVQHPPLVRASQLNVMRYCVAKKFEPTRKYRVTIDTLAIVGVNGLHNKPFSQEFAVRSLEEYSNLYLKVNVKDHAVVELLNSGDNVIATAPVVNGEAALENIEPGTYYVRLYLDTNGNGKWDAGHYATHTQPEEVYYYPSKFKLRRNWDVEQNWNIYAVAIDKQKPIEIVKAKPEQSKNALDRRDEANKNKNSNSDDDDDEFNSNAYGNGIYSGDKYRDSRNR